MNKTADWVLRIGVAFAFLYPPFNALSNPESWLGYFPSFIQTVPIDQTLLLHGFGVVEVVLALWLLSGKWVWYPAVIMTALLLMIVIFNLQNFEVIFRDLSIATAAAAIALTHSKAQQERQV
jgi:uncharacterized membrane protein YphA (DoxX/SURF4 family)